MSSDEPPSYGGWLSARRGSARKQAGAAGRSSEADRSSVGRKTAATEDAGSALSEDSASSVPQSPRAGKQLTLGLAKMGNYVAIPSPSRVGRPQADQKVVAAQKV